MGSLWGLAYDEDGADNCTSGRIKAAGAKESPHGEEAQGAVSNHESGRGSSLPAFHKAPYAKSKVMAPVAAPVLRGFSLRLPHFRMREEQRRREEHRRADFAILITMNETDRCACRPNHFLQIPVRLSNPPLIPFRDGIPIWHRRARIR
ncbi:hypothetical protein BMW22_06130 [Rhizobium leguminosarum]|uniref:Uncharacterized protein n=1 Tax=Rhizobium leguminosarum TaxID=384 RepID=A0A1L3Z6F8_RHILE|nr:hypothetical protein BMW22_06130 [Rhizobium leguminosarum]